MTTCPECGVEVMEGAGFCHKCGATIDGKQQASGAAAAADDVGGNPQPGTAAATERLRASAARQLNVGDEEVELWDGDYSPKAMMGTWILVGLATVAAIVVGVVMGMTPMAWGIMAGAIVLIWLGTLLVLWYKKLSVHYRLTNQRFIHQKGLLSRVTDRIEVIDMDDITFSQGVIERMLGVGTIKITSSDKTHPEIILLGIDNVRDVSTLMDDARRNERRRRGLHIETV